MMPGESSAQYRRNFARATTSVTIARVSVLKTDAAAPAESARTVQAIFTYSGSLKAAKCAGGNGRNTTLAFHGFVTAPTTISRPGTSDSTPHPIDVVKAT